ncbi:MAG: hypothetical protein ACT4PV_07060 [Planctomycetaceae bacterium]
MLAYNQAESLLSARPRASVLGRDFFLEVAPCTNVRELRGWIDDARDRAVTDSTRTSFVFAFPHGRVLVNLSLSYDAVTKQAHRIVERSLPERR